jgi:hypothetical protein
LFASSPTKEDSGGEDEREEPDDVDFDEDDNCIINEIKLRKGI